jgi:hypothetical protein
MKPTIKDDINVPNQGTAKPNAASLPPQVAKVKQIVGASNVPKPQPRRLGICYAYSAILGEIRGRLTLRGGFALIILVLLGACDGGPSGDADDAAADVNYNWKLVTAWPPNLPVNSEIVAQFAQDIESMSRGQMRIEVYAGGELIPALEVFDAVANGSTVQMGHAAAYYWAGKIPAAQFMSEVPFGLTARGMDAWLHGGDGLK